MKAEKYEELYGRALTVLKKRGKKTGKVPGEPYRTDADGRLVDIDNISYSDDRVFREAWGEYSAEAIFRKH